MLDNKNTGQIMDLDSKILAKTMDVSKKTGYDKINHVWILNSKEILENKNSSHLDFLEAGFWSWYSTKFNLHWEQKNEEFVGLSGSSGNGYVPKGSEKGSLKLKVKDKYLEINPAFKQVFGGNIMALPKGIEIKRDKISDNYREIELSTKEIDFIISFGSMGGSVLGGDELSNKIKSYLPKPDDWWANYIVVIFELNKKRFYQWSPRTAKLDKWVNKISNDFEKEFNWQDYKVFLKNNL